MKNSAQPPVRPVLEKYRSEIARCVKCGSCRAVCPPFLAKNEESFSPRGRMALIKAVLDGRLDISRIFEDRLETCTSCLACDATCASKVPLCDVMQAAREQAVDELGAGFVKTIIGGILENNHVMKAAARLAPLALHYSFLTPTSRNQICHKDTKAQRKSKSISRKEARPAFALPLINAGCKQKAQKKANSRGSVVFFPGCAVNYFQKDVGTAAIEVLSRMGFDTIVPEGLKCCGRPLLSLGDRNAAAETAAYNIGLFSDLKADAIVTACASCSLTFKREYPKLLRPGAEIPALLDIHEFVALKLQRERFLPLKRSITWHDPCHLNRGQGLAKAARELLVSIPGINLVEMKNADACCGFGGVMRVAHRKLSNAIAKEKVKNIMATTAGAVVTGCPGCLMQIRDALRRAGSGIEVIHTVQLLEEALSNAG